MTNGIFTCIFRRQVFLLKLKVVIKYLNEQVKIKILARDFLAKRINLLSSVVFQGDSSLTV